MSLFGTILDKLGFNRSAAAAPAAPPASKPGAEAPRTAPTPAPAAPAAPVRVTVVDVMGKIEGLAAASPQKLNWKTSIVDLLKLLGIDSSLPARKELATELGCPPEKMNDSAQMNIWLHKTVLQKLADNGGNVPKDLLS
jgi:uncharacterized protein DUF3597